MPKRVYIIFGLTIITLFLGGFIFSLYYPYVNSRFAGRNLPSLSFLKEKKPGIGVALRNNRKIRETMFYQINKEEPLFTGPGLDHKEFSAAVIAVEKTAENSQKAVENPKYFYPTEYLKKTLEVSQVTADYNQNPNIENTQKLIESQRGATEAYRDYALLIQAALKRRKLPDSLFGQEGGITSPELIKSDIAKMVQNSDKLNTEINKRELCLRVSTIFCHRNSLEIAPIEGVAGVSTEKVILPPKTNAIFSEYSASGPFSISTRCFRENAGDKAERLLYYYLSKNSQMATVELADNVYFQKITTEQYGTVLDERFKKHGVDWEMIWMSGSYVCNDQEYLSSVATLQAYYNKYSSEPLFAAAFPPEASRELLEKAQKSKELEEKLATEKYPSDVTLNILAASYADIYNYLSQEDGGLTSSDRASLSDKLLERFLFIKIRLADYPKQLQFMAFNARLHDDLASVNHKGKTEQDYSLFMRTNYGLNLMGFSPSVWLLKNKLTYLVPETRRRSDLLDYQNFKSKYGPEAIKKTQLFNRAEIIKEILAPERAGN